MDGPLTRAPLPLPSFDRGEGGNKTRIANCFFFLFSKEFVQFHPSHRANYPEFIPDFHPLFLSPRIIGAIRQWIRVSDRRLFPFDEFFIDRSSSPPLVFTHEMKSRIGRHGILRVITIGSSN